MFACHDCTYWLKGEDSELADMSGEWGECGYSEFGPGMALAVALPCEDYDTGETGRAVLVTHRNFGCVHHTARESSSFARRLCPREARAR